MDCTLTNQPIAEKSVGTRGSIYMMCTDNLFATHTLYITIYPTYNILGVQYDINTCDTSQKRVDFFALFANSLSVFRPFFSQKNRKVIQFSFGKPIQSSVVFLREIVTLVEDSQ